MNDCETGAGVAIHALEIEAASRHLALRRPLFFSEHRSYFRSPQCSLTLPMLPEKFPFFSLASAHFLIVKTLDTGGAPSSAKKMFVSGDKIAVRCS